MIETLHNAIKTLLTTDAAFVAALTLAFAGGGCGFATAPTAVIVNRPIAEVKQLHQSKLPCWLIETAPLAASALPGLSDDEHGLSLGGNQQAFRVLVAIGLIWNQQDHDLAYLQRLRVPVALVKLFLRNNDAGVDGCAMCIVAEVEPDQGLNHPMQIMRATLAADIVIERS